MVARNNVILWFFFVINFYVFFSTEGRRQSKKSLTEEDSQTLNESIARYGPVQDIEKLKLPGPQFVLGSKSASQENTWTHDLDKYKFCFRAIQTNFSYLERYEEGERKKNSDEEIWTVRGQFAEKFQRKDGGYYVRTIGYTLNEENYRQFLLDVSAIFTKEIEEPVLIVGGGAKRTIASTVLVVLSGGGALG